MKGGSALLGYPVEVEHFVVYLLRDLFYVSQ